VGQRPPSVREPAVRLPHGGHGRLVRRHPHQPPVHPRGRLRRLHAPRPRPPAHAGAAAPPPRPPRAPPPPPLVSRGPIARNFSPSLPPSTLHGTSRNSPPLPSTPRNFTELRGTSLFLLPSTLHFPPWSFTFSPFCLPPPAPLGYPPPGSGGRRAGPRRGAAARGRRRGRRARRPGRAAPACSLLNAAGCRRQAPGCRLQAPSPPAPGRRPWLPGGRASTRGSAGAGAASRCGAAGGRRRALAERAALRCAGRWGGACSARCGVTIALS